MILENFCGRLNALILPNPLRTSELDFCITFATL